MTKITISVQKIFKEIAEDVKWLRHDDKVTRELREQKIVRLGNNITVVRDQKLFQRVDDPATGVPYKNFSRWLKTEVQESRTSVYRYLGVHKYLAKVPSATLEEFGSSKCFELAKIAQHKPTLLPKFVKQIEDNPEIKLVTLKSMVANSLAGGHFDSGEYQSVEFAVKVEDMPYVVKGLAVVQALEGVSAPGTAHGRGELLVRIMQEYLSGDGESRTLKELEDAGAFSTGAFVVEE